MNKLISHLSQYINSHKGRTINYATKSITVFSDPLSFDKIHAHLLKDEIKQDLDKTDYNFLEENKLHHLLVEYNNFFFERLISFEFLSIGPMSYFSDIAILDIGDNYRYFIYHDDEQEPEIILRCNSNDISVIYRFVLTQIFSDSSFFGISTLEESLPTKIIFWHESIKYTAADLIFECIHLFLDKFTDSQIDEKWSKIFDDVTSKNGVSHYDYVNDFWNNFKLDSKKRKYNGPKKEEFINMIIKNKMYIEFKDSGKS